LVINFGKLFPLCRLLFANNNVLFSPDLPRSVEGYAQRVSAANQADANRNDRNRTGPAPSSIVLNFIQAAGGDVEMLRSTECAYRFKVRVLARLRTWPGLMSCAVPHSVPRFRPLSVICSKVILCYLSCMEGFQR